MLAVKQEKHRTPGLVRSNSAANTMDPEHHLIECHRPASLKEEYHTAWRQKERQFVTYFAPPQIVYYSTSLPYHNAEIKSHLSFDNSLSPNYN